MKTINVTKSIVYLRGTDVYYERYLPEKKKKGTLMFIHGFVSSSYSFRYLVPHFRKHYEVICVDLPGFGRSGKQRTFCYSFSNYADLIIDLLKLFNCGNVTVIGHSMGGQVALYTAKKEPSLIKRVVLLSSSGYLNRVRRRYVYASYVPFAKHMMKWWIGRRNVQQMFTQVVHNKKTITDDAVQEYSIPLADPHFCEGLICLMRQREGDLTKEELKKITQPCLILWGNEDRVIPERIGRRLASDLVHSSFYCFKESGHLLSEERPKDVAKKINTFLNGV